MLPLLLYLECSLLTHVPAFVLYYGALYWLFYGDNAFRRRVASYKCIPGVFPAPEVVQREFVRSLESTLVLVGWDCLVEARLLRSGAVPLLAGAAGLGGWLECAAFALLWSEFHFYMYHRASHEVKWVYRNIHKVHHESVNPNPFSGLSFHPVESLVYFSSLPLGLLLASRLGLVLTRPMYEVFKFALLLAPATGHLGYSFARIPPGAAQQDRLRALAATFSSNHFLHHEKFRYNYGSGVLSPVPAVSCDRLLGTEYLGPPAEGGPKVQ